MPQSSRQLRTPGSGRRSPVDPLQEHCELRRGQRHGSGPRRDRPYEPPLLQPLGEQTEALAVPPYDLDQVAPSTAEDKGLTRERVVLQVVLNQNRQTIEAL